MIVITKLSLWSARDKRNWDHVIRSQISWCRRADFSKSLVIVSSQTVDVRSGSKISCRLSMLSKWRICIRCSEIQKPGVRLTKFHIYCGNALDWVWKLRLTRPHFLYFVSCCYLSAMGLLSYVHSLVDHSIDFTKLVCYEQLPVPSCSGAG